MSLSACGRLGSSRWRWANRYMLLIFTYGSCCESGCTPALSAHSARGDGESEASRHTHPSLSKTQTKNRLRVAQPHPGHRLSRSALSPPQSLPEESFRRETLLPSCLEHLIWQNIPARFENHVCNALGAFAERTSEGKLVLRALWLFLWFRIMEPKRPLEPDGAGFTHGLCHL